MAFIPQMPPNHVPPKDVAQGKDVSIVHHVPVNGRHPANGKKQRLDDEEQGKLFVGGLRYRSG